MKKLFLLSFLLSCSLFAAPTYDYSITYYQYTGPDTGHVTIDFTLDAPMMVNQVTDFKVFPDANSAPGTETSCTAGGGVCLEAIVDPTPQNIAITLVLGSATNPSVPVETWSFLADPATGFIEGYPNQVGNFGVFSGEIVGLNSAAVPEPSTFALLGVAGLAFCWRRVRR